MPPPEEAEDQTKGAWTYTQKKEIVALWESGKFRHKVDIRKLLKKEKKWSIGKSTLNDWLSKDRQKIVETAAVTHKKIRKAMFEDVEKLVFEYICCCSRFNGTVTGDLLKKCAKEVTSYLNSKKGADDEKIVWNPSNGSETRFTKRFNVHSWKRCGEAASACEEGV